MGHADTLTCCHTEMLKSDHAVALTDKVAGSRAGLLVLACSGVAVLATNIWAHVHGLCYVGIVPC